MRPVGRPRVVPHDPAVDSREEILAAAARLFATGGYTATSTRAIADAVGLRQASLFHYYPRKEAILAELLEGTIRPTLDFVGFLERSGLGPEPTVWMLVHRDVANLGHSQYNAGALQLLPEVQSPQFSWFWQRRQSLFDYYRQQVDAGIAAGVFTAIQDAVAADLVFGLVESVITARPAVRADPRTPDAFADAALRLLGVTARNLRSARNRATTVIRSEPLACPTPG